MKNITIDSLPKGQPTVAISAASTYILAGGQRATAELRSQMADPDHPRRLDWESGLRRIVEQSPENTRYLVVPDGLGLNAARAVLTGKRQLFLLRDHGLHHFGRVERGAKGEGDQIVPSKEMTLYREVCDQAQGVIDAVATPERVDRDYLKGGRRNDEQERAKMAVEAADILISGSPVRTPEEEAFTLAGKTIEKQIPGHMQTQAAVGYWTLPIPSYKRDTQTVILTPTKENDLAQWNRSRKTTIPAAGDLLSLKNIYSENHPRPEQLTQEGTLNAIETLLTGSVESPADVKTLGQKLNSTSLNIQVPQDDGSSKAVRFDKINRELALAIFRKAKDQTNGSIEAVTTKMLEIVQNHRFMAAAELGRYQVQNSQVLSARQFAEALNNNPTAYPLPEELRASFIGADGKVSAEKIAQFALALENKHEPTAIEEATAKQMLDQARQGNAPDFSPSVRPAVDAFIEHAAQITAQINEIKAEHGDHNPQIPHLKKELSEETQRITREVAWSLNSPDTVKVNVMLAKRANEPIPGATSPEVLARTGLSEVDIYSVETRAWVANTLANGRCGGTTLKMQMNMLFKPPVDQERHPDNYHTPDNQTLTTEVSVDNVPAAALIALRAGDVDPATHEMLYFTNIIRNSAENEPRIEHTAKVNRQQMELVGNSLVSRQVKVDASVRANIGTASRGLLSLTTGDLEKATINNVGLHALLTAQRNAFIPNQISYTCNLSRSVKTGQIDELGENQHVEASRPMGPDLVPTTAVKPARLQAIVAGMGLIEDDARRAVSSMLTRLDGVLQGDKASIHKALPPQAATVVHHPDVAGDLSIGSITEALRSSNRNHITITVQALMEREKHLRQNVTGKDKLGRAVTPSESDKRELEEIRQVARSLTSVVSSVLQGATPAVKDVINAQKTIGDKIAVITGTAIKAEIPELDVATPANPDGACKVAAAVTKRSATLNTEANAKLVADVLYGNNIRTTEDKLAKNIAGGANEAALKLARANVEKAIKPHTDYLENWQAQSKAFQILATGEIKQSREWASQSMLEDISHLVYQETTKQLASVITSLPEGKRLPTDATSGISVEKAFETLATITAMKPEQRPVVQIKPYNPEPAAKVFEAMPAEERELAKQVVDKLVKHAIDRNAERQHTARAVAYVMKEISEGEGQVMLALSEGLAQTPRTDIVLRSSLSVTKDDNGQHYLLNGMNRLLGTNPDDRLREPDINLTESNQIASTLMQRIETSNAAPSVGNEAARHRAALQGMEDPNAQMQREMQEAGLYRNSRYDAGDYTDLRPNQVVVLTPPNHPSLSLNVQFAKDAAQVEWNGTVANVEDKFGRRTVQLTDGRAITGTVDRIPAKVGEEITVRGTANDSQLRVGNEPYQTFGNSLRELNASMPWLVGKAPAKQTKVEKAPEPVEQAMVR